MGAPKVAILTGTMTSVQRDLGEYGLNMDVSAFWAQFVGKYEEIARSLRLHTKNANRVVSLEDDMDEESHGLFLELLKWLNTM